MHFGYIYEIRNDLNGKNYVGKHECSEGNDDYMGSGILLPPAYKKYGIEHFTKRIIQYSPTEEHLNRSEELWIQEYKARGKAEYNIAAGGHGGNNIKYMTDEQKAEFRRKLRESHKGKKRAPFTEEHRRKVSEAHKGKKMSEESKRKNSEWHKGKPSPMKGRKHSEETKQRISEVKKGRSSPNLGKNKGKHWKLVDGKRTWY